MKEELQGKLAEILTSIQTAAGKASDFAMEQLPDIAQSYVAYGRVWLTLQALWLAVVVVAALFVAARYGFMSTKKTSYGHWADERIFAAAAGSVIALVSSSFFMSMLQPVILVWLAPKVWLLKELAHMLK